MKNITIYIVAAITLILGIILGYFIFGNAETVSSNKEVRNTTSADLVVYTCSMHPQIRQNEPGDCPICGMDLIPLGSSNSGSDPIAYEMTEEAVAMANIQTSKIEYNTDINNIVLNLNGRIQYDETKNANIVTHIPGRIEHLDITYTGQEIKKGQKIASIYSPDLIAAQQELIEAKKLSGISPGLLDAAKNKLKFWKIGPNTIEKIMKSEKIREIFPIYSDHSGVVFERKATIGDYLSTGEVLFKIKDINKLWAIFEVYENDLSKIDIGDELIFSTPSLPGESFSTVITFIDPLIDPKTRVLKIRADINNNDNRLKPEMFLTAGISLEQNLKNLVVPKSAVLWTGKRSVVYVRLTETEIPTFEYREVGLGAYTGNSYVIKDGLKIGDEVVTNGAFIIDASAQLNNQQSMMNKKVKLKKAGQILSLPDYTETTPKLFKKQFEMVIDSYLKLKDALVATDPDKASGMASEFNRNLNKVDVKLLNAEEQNFWIGQAEEIRKHSEHISRSKLIKDQRKQFLSLSAIMIKLVKVYGVSEGTFYVQYCPMADNNNGGDWISIENKIRNPYFGDKMLKCGSIRDTIDSNYKNPQNEHQPNTTQNIHNH